MFIWWRRTCIACVRKTLQIVIYVQDQFIFMGGWNKQLRLRFSQHQLFGPACILCLLASIWFVCKDPSRNMSKSGWSSLQPIWTHTSPQWSWPQFQSLPKFHKQRRKKWEANGFCIVIYAWFKEGHKGFGSPQNHDSLLLGQTTWVIGSLKFGKAFISKTLHCIIKF